MCVHQLPIALELHVLAAGSLAKHQVPSPRSTTTCSSCGIAVPRSLKSALARVRDQVLIGMVILAMVYTMIIFNLIHHTIAALMGSFVALGTCPSLSHTHVVRHVVHYVLIPPL
jgi:hypothetical protein